MTVDSDNVFPQDKQNGGKLDNQEYHKNYYDENE